MHANGSNTSRPPPAAHKGKQAVAAYDKFEEQGEAPRSSARSPHHRASSPANGTARSVSPADEKDSGEKKSGLGDVSIEMTGGQQPTLAEMDEEERRDKQAHTDELMRKKKLMTVLAVADLVGFFLLYIAIHWGFEMDDFAEDDVDNYKFGSSLFDLFFITIFKSLVHYCNLALLHSDVQRSRLLTSLAYWTTFIGFIAAICKVIVLDWNNAASGVTALFSLFMNAAELFVMTSLLPKAGENDWDPHEAEEQENKVSHACVCNTLCCNSLCMRGWTDGMRPFYATVHVQPLHPS